nr:hypothetical protein [Tanacetum cinerariifolium]
MNQNHYDPNSFYDSNSFDFDQFQPSQFPVIYPPIREKTRAKLLAEEQESNIDTQPFKYSVVPQPPQKEISVKFLQEKRNQIDSMKTFLRKFNRISFYEMPKVLSLAWETILEIELAFEDKHCQLEDILELFQRLHNDVQNIHEELTVYINTSSWDRPTVCYDDDDDEDYTIAITPILSTKEPDNSLSMRDEHLDTISETESDEFIKSRVESLVPIPSESEGIPGNMCDVPFHVLCLLTFQKINLRISPILAMNLLRLMTILSLLTTSRGIDDDILLTIKDDILCENFLNVNLLIANIEALKDNPLHLLISRPKEISSGSTTTRYDISLPEYEAFYNDHVKDISSGSTTTYSNSSLYDSFIFDLLINPFPASDRSDFYEFTDELAHIIYPPKYDCLCFKNEPNAGDFTMDVVEDILPTREPRVHNHNVLPTHPTL